jgi:tRNA (adenine22-N1)-methyltransferase
MDDRVPPLSPRLAALASAIAPGSRVADVGSDHGKLGLWLAASGRADYCLSTERTEALLDRVSRAPADAPWASRLAYRAEDGLGAIRLEDRIDTIVLAGLGGATIVRLLSGAEALRWLTLRLVLQPRSEVATIRRWLSENGWRLTSERLTFWRRRFHSTLAAERGRDADLYSHETLSREDLLVAGPLLARSKAEEVVRFWEAQRDRLASFPGDGSRAGVDRAQRILDAISPRAG